MEDFNEITYPITIILDKYGGKYSGGVWTAWNNPPRKIPSKAFDDDEKKCSTYWKNNKIYKYHIVGVGKTPSEAYIDLLTKLKTFKKRKYTKKSEKWGTHTT